MSKPGIAYQLYSARDEAQQDVNKVLAEIKRQGYEGVEFAGFYGLSDKEVVALLEKHGLKAASSHVALSIFDKDPEEVIHFHKAIGCKYIAIPYLDEHNRPGNAGFAELIPQLYRYGQMCKDAGIQLLYHNHDFEFERVSGTYGLSFLFAAVPADLLQTELDTCWVKYAGVDPIEYLHQYKGRAPVVHLKDFVGHKTGQAPYQLIGKKFDENAAKAPFAFKPLGHGIQDIAGIVQAAIDAGAKWLVVEQDDHPEMPPLEASRMSMETLKSIL